MSVYWIDKFEVDHDDDISCVLFSERKQTNPLKTLHFVHHLFNV